MFETCNRQYYYHYYGSWGGWNRTADARTRLLYQLKKMTTVPMLVGTVVHQTISRVLEALQTGREMPVDAAVEQTFRLFKQGWQASKHGRWQQAPSKCVNLFEHYYNQPLTDTELREWQARMERAVRTFYAADYYRTFQSLPPAAWLSREALEAFPFDGHTIWVTLDLAVRQNGNIYIYDWKTGKERKADETQLAVYALYATQKWHAPLQDLVLQDIYLQKGNRKIVEIDPDAIDQTGTEIRESIQTMQTHLDNPLENTASEAHFSMTDNRNACDRCPFKSVCFPEPQPRSKPAAPEQLTLGF